MRAELANLNHCAVPFLSRGAPNLCWYNTITYLQYKIWHGVTVYNIEYLNQNAGSISAKRSFNWSCLISLEISKSS